MITPQKPFRHAAALLGQLALVGTAAADPTFGLTGREGELYLSTMTGGVGTASVQIDPVPGSLTANDLAPSFLQLAGTGNASATSSPFTATIEATWDLRQDYSVTQSVDGVVLHASGSMQVAGSSSGTSSGVPSVGPFNHSKHNYQELHFTLTQNTSYLASGVTWGDEYIQIRPEGGGSAIGAWNWVATYGPGATPADWSFSGLLAAGDYVISNRLIPLNNSGWDYTVTFLGATVAPVPEPETYALLLAGLATLAARIRPPSGAANRAPLRGTSRRGPAHASRRA